MGTRHVIVTPQYTDVLAQQGSTFYTQNKGSSKIELFIGESAPDDSEEGLVLYPEGQGYSVTLQGLEICFAKTEGTTDASTLLMVE